MERSLSHLQGFWFYWFEAGRETRGSTEDPKATKTYPAPGVKSAWEENIGITLNQLSEMQVFMEIHLLPAEAVRLAHTCTQTSTLSDF